MRTRQSGLIQPPELWVFGYGSLMWRPGFPFAESGPALLKGAHVRTDMLWEKFSERKKGTIDLVSYVLLFYPTLITLMVISIDDAWYAYTIAETSEQTPWRPIMWPFRSAIPLAALLLMIQGVSEMLKCWFQIKFEREFEHREKIEV